MARIDTNDEDAVQRFAVRCGCPVDQVKHAIQARTANEMDIVSYLALRGFITQDVFLRLRNEIS